MKIQGQRSETLRPATQSPAVQGTNGTSKTQATTGTAGVSGGTTRSDSVQISDAGRALSTGDAAGTGSTLSSERVAELRRRVLEGAYNTTHVVGQVAQRILDRGDV
jgi:anti-sigma28 factor (negative regulator of flagellin synthesis)